MQKNFHDRFGDTEFFNNCDTFKIKLFYSIIIIINKIWK